jgi:hypothetical protein
MAVAEETRVEEVNACQFLPGDIGGVVPVDPARARALDVDPALVNGNGSEIPLDGEGE